MQDVMQRQAIAQPPLDIVLLSHLREEEVFIARRSDPIKDHCELWVALEPDQGFQDISTWAKHYAATAPIAFHTPGEPAVTQTQPSVPPAADATSMILSPTFAVPVVGADAP